LFVFLLHLRCRHLAALHHSSARSPFDFLQLHTITTAENMASKTRAGLMFAYIA
jgi:hypothetical protein